MWWKWQHENIGHESAQLSAPKSMALTIAMLHVIQMMFIDTDCHATYTTNCHATYTTNDVYRTTSPYRDTNFPHPTQKWQVSIAFNCDLTHSFTKYLEETNITKNMEYLTLAIQFIVIVTLHFFIIILSFISRLARVIERRKIPLPKVKI